MLAAAYAVALLINPSALGTLPSGSRCGADPAHEDDHGLLLRRSRTARWVSTLPRSLAALHLDTWLRHLSRSS